ncbi:MAG: response regulator transcription factor [Frankiaceae bacterium]|nr:response regulator transcription factor [Frankiaceae bacterium]
MGSVTAARVLIADDHPPTRAGVRWALEHEGGFEVCAELANATDAVDAAVELRPDIALLDIHMPGGGINAAAEIAAAAPDTAIVMLTVSRDDEDLFAALRAGARGYLLKDIDPARLPMALQGVLSGEAALPRGLVAHLIDEFRSRDSLSGRRAGLFATLTEREWEVLTLMQEGLPTTEMAARMFVTPVTVRTHVSAILRKLQVSDRAAAVRLANRG